MRYSIGQIVPFINFEFNYSNGNKGGLYRFSLPAIWQGDQILKTTISLMTCVSHHKVNKQYDAKRELNCDGFIFEDEKGNKWFNQYPEASYGQFSDIADGIIQLDLANKTIKEWETNGQKNLYNVRRLKAS